MKVSSLMEDSDLVSINDKLVSLNLDLTVEAAVSGVILEHVDLERQKETSENISNKSAHKNIYIC